MALHRLQSKDVPDMDYSRRISKMQAKSNVLARFYPKGTGCPLYAPRFIRYNGSNTLAAATRLAA